MEQKALIYCRVSSVQQVLYGTGLSSQEQLCRDYCRMKGYTVEKVFIDDGVSGGLLNRPGMQSLLDYLAGKNTNYIVVFDDLKRFARNIEVHIALRKTFKTLNATLESPNFKFEDTPEGEFVEKVMALTNELERNQNRRQVIQKQKARLMQGYWTFCPPPGMKFTHTKEHGKILVPDGLLSNVYKEAIERYAFDSAMTQQGVTDFIKVRYEEKGIDRKISNNGSHRILTEILYTGFLEYKEWEVPLMKGKHDGFISYETYSKVQDKLFKRTHIFTRTDYREDFILRGLILCSCCQKPLTASWSKGRSKKYPFYTCKTPGCPFRWKSIRRDNLETDFTNKILNAKIKEQALELARVVFTDVWETKSKEVDNHGDLNLKRIEEINMQLKNLSEAVSRTSNDQIKMVHEAQMEELMTKKTTLEGPEVVKPKYTAEEFGTALNELIETLKNPLKTWKSEYPEVRRNLVSTYFDPLPGYDRINKFGTTDYRQEINIIRSFENPNCHMVEMGGIEPPC
jgi:site-specific DNA recombinase